jgi:hypothetical protein
MKTKARIILLILSLLVSNLAALHPGRVRANAAGPYIHNALGGLRIGYVVNGATNIVYDDPYMLKNVLDGVWNRVHDQVNNRLLEFGRARLGSNREVRSVLAKIDQTELRLLQQPDGVALKYVLHENRIYIKVKTPWPAPDVEFVTQFSIELAMTLQVSADRQPLRVTYAGAFVRNSKIDGHGLAGDIAKPIVDTFVKDVQALEAQINSISVPLTDAVNKSLAPFSNFVSQMPTGLVHVSAEVEAHSGKLSLCFRLNPTERCAFPASPERISPRSVLTTSIDRCSRPVVWIWDVEKEHHVGIRKGDRNVEVQVNWEFSWWCGWHDKLGTKERAAGPKESSGVRVHRASNGRQIDWHFLYWR